MPATHEIRACFDRWTITVYQAYDQRKDAEQDVMDEWRKVDREAADAAWAARRHGKP